MTLARISTACIVLMVLAGQLAAAVLAQIQVSQDARGFVLAGSGRPFVPWGFNYDHDEAGRLLEDYWLTEWPKVEADFREMKELGANVVRIHLQFGKFMETADMPNTASLRQLAKLLNLAARTGLYLNLTGLGCYHKADVPAWYDALDERARWAAQANFWAAIAKQCRGNSAVFCYDLMNEPVVAGGKRKSGEWLGPPFGGKHFVQFITLDAAGRLPHAVAGEWIRTLTRAIRRHDERKLITVGLVDWSLDRPGLRSGFVPEKVVADLDFLSVHLYPKQGEASRPCVHLPSASRWSSRKHSPCKQACLNSGDSSPIHGKLPAAGWVSIGASHRLNCANPKPSGTPSCWAGWNSSNARRARCSEQFIRRRRSGLVNTAPHSHETDSLWLARTGETRPHFAGWTLD